MSAPAAKTLAAGLLLALLCLPYQEFVQAMQAKGEAYYSERTRRYILISDGVLAVLWSCAADRIAEAEQVLTQKSRKSP